MFITDLGSQLSTTGSINVLKAGEIARSMDGKDVWRSNVFVERLWRTVSYEVIDL